VSTKQSLTSPLALRSSTRFRAFVQVLSVTFLLAFVRAFQGANRSGTYFKNGN
jgi:hypothetical protein